MCGGVDSKLSIFRKLEVKDTADRWVLDRTRAVHTHDVAAVAIGRTKPTLTLVRASLWIRASSCLVNS